MTTEAQETSGTVTMKFVLPDAWQHVPYTVELAEAVGKVYRELDVALRLNQQSLAMMVGMLEAERVRIAGETEEERARREVEKVKWWQDQKEERMRVWRMSWDIPKARNAKRRAKSRERGRG